MFTLRLLGGAVLDGPDGPVAGRAALRQRVALLALLAVEHPRPLGRDRLVAWLWPESDTSDARHLLRESLYILRSALGEDALPAAGDDLRLDPGQLTCDLWEFGAALARDDLEAAVALYHGPFLDGFHLSGAEEFGHWADAERSRLARRYREALERLAEGAMGHGDPRRATEWLGRLAAEDPYSSRIALRYMEALEAAGDRAAALRHAAAHTALLRADLDAAPEREVVAFAERLRVESRAAPGPPAPIEAAPALPASLHAEGPDRLTAPVAAQPARVTRRRWVPATVLLLAVVVGVGLVGGVLSRARPPALSSRRVAAAVFENRTGRPDLDDLGALAADWIVRGVMETPLLDVTELEAVYARGNGRAARPADPLVLARQDSAGMVIRGSYWLSGDSVLFQAGIIDVASGRVLRSFDPVGAPIERTTTALEALRDAIAGGLGPLVNPLNRGSPVDPELVPLPNLPAYREFVAGLKEENGEVEARHYRRAAELDSTFVAPLIQLAFRASVDDDCSTTDSIGTVLDARRAHLSPWNRMTIDLMRARCRGDMAEALSLLGQRYRAYPRSLLARGTYASVLQFSNQPRAAREILRGVDPLSAEWAPWYWHRVAGSLHTLGEYQAELEITDRWRDSATWEWQVVRGRALAALGREREVMELLRRRAGMSVDSLAGQQLTIATELAVHGHPRTAMAIAESLLARLELGPDPRRDRAPSIAWANRLLGRPGGERAALERVARDDPDSLSRLEARARLTVLRDDTAEAEEIDRALAEQSERPLGDPWRRGRLILTRAHIAAGLGRRERAVALLRQIGARGHIAEGPSHAFHRDLLLLPLRGYPPFDALLQPDN